MSFIKGRGEEFVIIVSDNKKSLLEAFTTIFHMQLHRHHDQDVSHNLVVLYIEELSRRL